MHLLIVDDGPMLGTALAIALGAQDSLVVSGVCTSDPILLRSMSHCQVEVVVINVRFGAGNGVGLMEALRNLWPAARLLVLAGNGPAGSVDRARVGGSDTCMSTEESFDGLMIGIAAAADRERIPTTTPAALEAHTSVLTTRELELLTLLVGGATTAHMATTLFISPHTVRNHLKKVMHKLDVHTRAEAVGAALRRDIVGLDPRV